MQFKKSCKRIDAEKYGWWHSYLPLMRSLGFPGAKVLDLGCGWRYRSSCSELEEHCKVIGFDIDPGLSKQILRSKVRGDAHKLPFSDSSFDLVNSVYVLEHIENPKNLFEEVYRILKPGGSLLILTNSVFNPVIWSAKLLPQQFHRILISKILRRGNADHDNARVFYRANSVTTIKKLATDLNFTSLEIFHMSGMYEYFEGIPSLMKLILQLSNLFTNNSKLAFLKLNLIVLVTK